MSEKSISELFAEITTRNIYNKLDALFAIGKYVDSIDETILDSLITTDNNNGEEYEYGTSPMGGVVHQLNVNNDIRDKILIHPDYLFVALPAICVIDESGRRVKTSLVLASKTNATLVTGVESKDTFNKLLYNRPGFSVIGVTSFYTPTPPQDLLFSQYRDIYTVDDFKTRRMFCIDSDKTLLFGNKLPLLNKLLDKLHELELKYTTNPDGGIHWSRKLITAFNSGDNIVLYKNADKVNQNTIGTNASCNILNPLKRVDK